MAQCQNNMAQLGKAMHNFENQYKRLPHETRTAPATAPSWPTLILPFIEQQNAVPGTTLVVLLCPSRGQRLGGKNDYSGAYSASIGNTAGGSGALNGGQINGMVVIATAYQSILDPNDNVGIPISKITRGAGTSNTLLLAHSILDPSLYNGGASNDTGWWQTYASNGTFPNMRWTDANGGADHGYIHDSQGVDENHMGGPHIGASPVLWADGSVRNYQYMYTCCNAVSATAAEAADTAVWQAFWAYNRVNVLQLPDQ